MTNSVENFGTTPKNSSTNLGGNGTINPGIDSNHPYFLTHSDAPAKNKLGFITGAQSAPAAGSPDLQPWSRCNDMVTSWLLNSLSREIVDSVIYSRFARELWISLEH
ncbi:hypothetical protein KY290_015082 [Solanum tuberosum]|uniref:Retrotransposon Copia-like N-terminal domain-containing protein n=1 Tax=Solanum tuberosum TaxID=4113 RepID=A0ABQ7VRH8_SOLTU|nr:hypothetical protein KY290_015082 [Solanum tuberosum]